ncbi:MAG: PAS domain-containing protein, partial [Deltaproteobacteria bacterium]|nr:PAS domain-containing protein [Deltaproteobacteria bacterium]
RHLAITGRTREELLGQNWSRYIPQADRKKLLSAWRCAAKSGEAFVYEYRYEHSANPMKQVQAEVQAELDGQGKV